MGTPITILEFADSSSSGSSISGLPSMTLSGTQSYFCFTVGRRLKFLLWPLEGPAFPFGFGIGSLKSRQTVRDAAAVRIPNSFRSFFRPPGPTRTMFNATAPVLSKALRRALTPKRGNKDFYKGAFADHRVGADRGITCFVLHRYTSSIPPGRSSYRCPRKTRRRRQGEISFGG